jgi:small redox-active disulfide protein 2
MKNIKVLGTGCANCKTTMKLIDETARAGGIAIKLEKVEDMAEIMSYGILSTPGVVVDGKVVHSGGIPDKNSINSWLSDVVSSGCCGGDVSASSGCCS